MVVAWAEQVDADGDAIERPRDPAFQTRQPVRGPSFWRAPVYTKFQACVLQEDQWLVGIVRGDVRHCGEDIGAEVQIPVASASPIRPRAKVHPFTEYNRLNMQLSVFGSERADQGTTMEASLLSLHTMYPWSVR